MLGFSGSGISSALPSLGNSSLMQRLCGVKVKKQDLVLTRACP